MAATQQFNCVSNSSFSDVCLNTYGSMDYYVQGLLDNSRSPNETPASGQAYMWDSSLVADQSLQQVTNTNNIIYATLFGLPDQPKIPTVGQYTDTRNAYYTASAEGETIITVPAIQGGIVIQIEREIKPLLPTQYSVDNSNNPSLTGTITLAGGLSLSKGETLAILYKVTVNY